MKKGLSQAQRYHLLKKGKDDAKLAQQMVEAFDRSDQTLDKSITNMTNCLTSLGEGVASGMQMLAMALSGTTPQVHPSTLSRCKPTHHKFLDHKPSHDITLTIHLISTWPQSTLIFFTRQGNTIQLQEVNLPGLCLNSMEITKKIISIQL